MDDLATEAANPIHQRSDRGVAWTTVNAAENIPGILTPLGYDFWIRGVDVGTLSAFASLGVVPRRQVREDRDEDDRVGGAFYGRFAVNVSEFRRLMDLTPGGSGDVFVEQIFGTPSAGTPARSSRLRYPIVALKAPVLLSALPWSVPRSCARSRGWWRGFTSSGEHRDSRAQLAEALRMMQRAVRMQMFATFAAQGLYERICQVASSAGRPELQLQLASGYGGIEETRMVSALHRVARGEASVEEFLEVYGARCAGENDLSTHSWRERPDAIVKLAQKYRDAHDRPDPMDDVDGMMRGRIAAERDLLSDLPPVRRLGVRLMLRLARTFIPLREEAKGLMAMAMDAGRFAARNRGRELVAAAVLDDVEDVFLLSLDEVHTPPDGDLRDLVQERRSLRARYKSLELPRYWLGDPDPIPVGVPGGDSIDEVRGIGGAVGVAEGEARVLLDPDEIESVEPNEILVCRTTDPSWATVFHLVSAVVIDIGGTGSHGAIVSREMGLPCVINTGNGTSVLRTGDRLRVDGTAGTVEVLERAQSLSPVRTPTKTATT